MRAALVLKFQKSLSNVLLVVIRSLLTDSFGVRCTISRKRHISALSLRGYRRFSSNSVLIAPRLPGRSMHFQHISKSWEEWKKKKNLPELWKQSSIKESFRKATLFTAPPEPVRQGTQDELCIKQSYYSKIRQMMRDVRKANDLRWRSGENIVMCIRNNWSAFKLLIDLHPAAFL